MKKAIITIVTIAVLFFAIKSGAEKIEQAECESWKLQAEEYQGFYYTEWQADQCKIK